MSKARRRGKAVRGSGRDYLALNSLKVSASDAADVQRHLFSAVEVVCLDAALNAVEHKVEKTRYHDLTVL